MSLRVDNGRSRGRSKSPGRKDERSRSRDVRAPSPAVIIKMSSSKKYESDESDSDTRTRKKSSKKYYDDSESDSDTRSKKRHAKKHHDSDDSDSDPKSRKKSSRRHRDDSDSDSKSKRKSYRKHHGHSDSDSDSKHKKKSVKKRYESDSSSSSSEDDRKTKHKSSTTLVRTDRGNYVEVSNSKSKYEHGEHGHGKRHLSNSSVESGEKYRQGSMPGGFNGGYSPHPQYANDAPSAFNINALANYIDISNHKLSPDQRVSGLILAQLALVDPSMLTRRMAESLHTPIALNLNSPMLAILLLLLHRSCIVSLSQVQQQGLC